MDQLMVENLASGTGEGAVAPHPPRRPRVREVSSRFMSPVAGDPFPTRSPLPRHQNQQGVSTPSQRSRRHLDLEPFRCSDENRPTRAESPLPPDQQARKQRPVNANAKPLKENGGGSRPDTPMVTASLDRTPSRPRLIQHRVSATAAAKLLKTTTSEANIQEATSRCLSDIRSSMPEANMLPTVSSRQTSEKSCNNGGGFSKISSSPCSRSLNLPLSSSEHLLFQSVKGSEKLASALSKPCTNAVNTGGLCLPPVPPCATAKPASEFRKGKKEDAHSLRLLHNRYLQWRYANATAEASLLAQQRETEVSS